MMLARLVRAGRSCVLYVYLADFDILSLIATCSNTMTSLNKFKIGFRDSWFLGSMTMRLVLMVS